MIDSCAVLGWDMADGVVLDYGFIVVCESFLNVQGEAVGAIIVCRSLDCDARIDTGVDREGSGLGVDGACVRVARRSSEGIDPSEWD